MPKRIGRLFPAVTEFENLYKAYRQARKGKGDRQEVARFDLNLEAELVALQRELINDVYQPGAYRHRTIYERKPRLISIAPFRDRVVHHALMQCVDPLLDRSLIDHSYACRQGKGVHRAVDQYQQWAAGNDYVMHLDIAQYFASVDHGLLEQQLACKIKDKRVLGLFRQIIRGHESSPGKGLPIGNLTSQFLANYYLNHFDHWLQSMPGCHGYLRYVDDFFIFGRDKVDLWSLVRLIEKELAALCLQLHPRKINMMRTAERVDVLGYLVTKDRRWLRNDNGYRFRRRLKSMAGVYAKGDLNLQDIEPRVQSWIGHAIHAETNKLRKEIFAGVVFSRATEPA